MNSTERKQTIKVAPINITPGQQSIITAELDELNASDQRKYQYQFLGNGGAREAEILIARVDATDLDKTNKLMQRVYGAKSTVFLVNKPDSHGIRNYKYTIKHEELGNDLVDVLDAACFDIYGKSNAKPKPESSSPGRNSDTDLTPEEKSDVQYVGNIMVVDDSPSVRTQMSLYLTKRQFKFALAESAEAALRIAQDKSFDLIFMDIIMPGADGYQACKAFKSLNNFDQVPIILLTSKNSPVDKIHGIMSGCDKYLTKPVRASELDELLRGYFPSFNYITRPRA